jgi:hypothetical protein
VVTQSQGCEWKEAEKAKLSRLAALALYPSVSIASSPSLNITKLFGDPLPIFETQQ